jgi:hypothetical protein
MVCLVARGESAWLACRSTAIKLTGDNQYSSYYDPNPGKTAAGIQAQEARYQESPSYHADHEFDKFFPGGSHGALMQTVV